MPTCRMPSPATANGWLEIVSHLLSDAVKFTEQGAIVIARARAGSLERSVVLHCSVRDTGISIAPDKIARIFQPSWGGTSSTRRFGGTRLSLSILAAARRDDGRPAFWVESSPSAAATSQFTLRLERQPARPTCAAAQWTGMRAAGDGREPERARRARTPALRYWGFQVAAAGVADEAERLLQERAGFGQHFELALFDETQPGTVELLRRIAPPNAGRACCCCARR